MSVVSLRKDEWIPTAETFAKLLEWLDSDREQAAEKYEEIRRKLIKIFVYRGCLTAEELADETIDRVSRKIDELATNFVGDKKLYFYGVAQNVHREYLRKRSRPSLILLTPSEEDADGEFKLQCLDRCLEQLSEADRELILEYYREEKQNKIKNRKSLAQSIQPNTLRKKMQRIRERLKLCLGECLQKRGI